MSFPRGRPTRKRSAARGRALLRSAYSRDLVANVADPLDLLFVAGVTPDLDATLPAYPMPAARAHRADVVKSTERRAASRALASLVR